MVKMGYAAVGVGELDARLGSEFYAKMAAHKLTVVDTSPTADKSAVPFVLKTVGGVKVGIISFGASPPNVAVDEMALRKTRFTALKEARAKCDVLVLLDQAGVATREWVDRNAPRVGAPDIVIRGYGEGKNDNEDNVGATHIMPAMLQCKQMGLIDIEVTPGQAPRVGVTRVTLDETYAENPELLKQINDAMTAMALPATEVPDHSHTASGVGPPKPTYSNRLCKACHLAQYEDWAKTKHARALQTLIDQKKTTPECLSCHSERFRTAQQFTQPDNGLGGVDCATCHAASLPHGMERKAMAERTPVPPSLCLQCHTKERSPDYDEKTFFPMVAHKSAAAATTASVPAAK